MIAALMSRTTWYAAAALLAGVALWWIHGAIYQDGYQAASSKYEAVLAKERADAAEADGNEQRRQAIANNAAKKREADAVAKLEAEQSENLELRRKLASEAQQDPDADKPVLGAGSVQRINEIR